MEIWLKSWDGEIILDYPSEANLMTRVFKSREIFPTVVKKMKNGDMSQRTLEVEKGKWIQKGMQPC